MPWFNLPPQNTSCLPLSPPKRTQEDDASLPWESMGLPKYLIRNANQVLHKLDPRVWGRGYGADRAPRSPPRAGRARCSSADAGRTAGRAAPTLPRPASSSNMASLERRARPQAPSTAAYPSFTGVEFPWRRITVDHRWALAFHEVVELHDHLSVRDCSDRFLSRAASGFSFLRLV